MASSIMLHEIKKDKQEQIPMIVRLLENPKSLIPFPGQISLEKHDYLHLFLKRKVSPKDEAFVVGFTLGIDEKTRKYHLFIFKFFCQYLYPPKFRMNDEDWFIFKLGFYYGQKIRKNNQDKTAKEWEEWKNNLSLASISERQKLGIKMDELNLFKQLETILF